jgi:hypothetical protein
MMSNQANKILTKTSMKNQQFNSSEPCRSHCRRNCWKCTESGACG